MPLTMNTKFIAVDQYGDTLWLKDRPRKELLEKLDASTAEKMYVDTEDGVSHHIGYIVRGHWYEIFRVAPAFEPEKVEARQ